MKLLLVVLLIGLAAPAFSQNKDSSAIASPCETMAGYPGGLQALCWFLLNNMHISVEGLKPGCTRFYLKFTVLEDGRVGDATLSTKDGARLEWNAELKRVFKLAPAWQPATKEGKPVKSFYNLPLRIRIM